MRDRRVLLFVLALLPAALLPLGMRALADAAAARAAAALSRAADALTPEPEAIDVASLPLVGIGEPANVSLPYPVVAVDGEPPAPAKKSVRPRGILVRKAAVEHAARSGARPTGTMVAATGLRPAGVALAGVSALGAGLRDGDVVTSVAGASASSPAAVAAAAEAAVRARVPSISAVVWRGDQRMQVLIELPTIPIDDR